MTKKFWDRPYNSAQTAYDMFGFIAATQAPLPVIEAFDFAESLIGSAFNIRYQADNDASPRMMFAVSEEALLIGIAGAQTLYQFQGLLSGYSREAAPLEVGGTNDFATPVILRLLPQILELTAGRSMRIYVGGYSYGSVIAAGLVRLLSRDKPGVDVRLAGYGPPKPGGTPLQRWFGRDPLDSWRQYVCDNDPVPLIYPTETQAPRIHAVVPRRTSLCQSSYGPATQYWQLPPDGSDLKLVTFPDRQTGNPETAITGWLSGREGWNTSGHHFTTYKQRLFLLSKRFPDTEEDRDEPFLRELEKQEVAQLSPTPYQPITPTIQSPGDMPRPLPPSPIPAGRGRAGTGGVEVEWNGVPIATMPTIGKARNLRNTLRRLATSVRQAQEFQVANMDDAILYNQLIVSEGIRPTYT